MGYDIESKVEADGRLRFIEVKGRVAGALTVTVTRNEILTATPIRTAAVTLLSFANEIAVPAAAEADRARHLEKRGFSPFDALHLAVAEQAAVDVFLTTDDGILHRARRSLALLRVRVENPVSWYLEVQHASHE